MPVYTVRDDVTHVAGQPVPETQEVALSEDEALYELAMDRIALKEGTAEVPAGDISLVDDARGVFGTARRASRSSGSTEAVSDGGN